jgi:hypothetical protein
VRFKTSCKTYGGLLVCADGYMYTSQSWFFLLKPTFEGEVSKRKDEELMSVFPSVKNPFKTMDASCLSGRSAPSPPGFPKVVIKDIIVCLLGWKIWNPTVDFVLSSKVTMVFSMSGERNRRFQKNSTRCA